MFTYEGVVPGLYRSRCRTEAVCCCRRHCSVSYCCRRWLPSRARAVRCCASAAAACTRCCRLTCAYLLPRRRRARCWLRRARLLFFALIASFGASRVGGCAIARLLLSGTRNCCWFAHFLLSRCSVVALAARPGCAEQQVAHTHPAAILFVALTRPFVSHCCARLCRSRAACALSAVRARVSVGAVVSAAAAGGCCRCRPRWSRCWRRCS